MNTILADQYILLVSNCNNTIKDENIEDKNIEDENLEDENLEDENLEDENLEDENLEDENITLAITLKEEIILNINNENIIYPNEKIYQVASIIEEKIVERDNFRPNSCLLYCQNCIRMLLDIATRIYIFLERMIQWASMILIIIDIFNITRKKIKIIGRSKYNYFTIENAESERLRRIVYWFYYNNITPDEDEWRATMIRFNLSEIPKFTMRLYIHNEKSKYTIDLNNLELQTYVNNTVVKGIRNINLYEDIINETIDNIYISIGRRLLKNATGVIPVGGLMPEKFISDLGVNKPLINKNN